MSFRVRAEYKTMCDIPTFFIKNYDIAHHFNAPLGIYLYIYKF